MRAHGTGDLTEPLVAVERERATGILEIDADRVITRVYVQGGLAIYAEAGAAGESLARVLLRAELLTEAQLLAVLERAADDLHGAPNVHLGELIVRYGVVTHEEFDLAMAEQVRQKIIGCILREHGDWTFRAGAAELSGIAYFPVPLRPLFYEAAVCFSEQRLQNILSAGQERYPELVEAPATVVSAFALNEEEAALLSRLDGMTSVRDLTAESAMVDASVLLAALVLVGAVTLHETPTQRSALAAAPLPTLDSPPEPAAASDAAPVHTRAECVAPAGGAASEVARSVPPPTANEPGPPKRRISRQMAAVVKPTVQGAQARAEAALKRLLEERKRRAPPAPEATAPRAAAKPSGEAQHVSAETAFQQGRALLNVDQLERALPLLRRAREMAPQEKEYELYAVWVEARVAGALKEASRRESLRRLALGLVKAAPDCGLAPYVLAHLALSEGEEEVALRMFRRAAEIDAQLIDANRHARLIAMRRERSESAPLFGRSDGKPNKK